MENNEEKAEPTGASPEPFRLLFVCTGNTCRSPLAEALARRALLEREIGQVEVLSAGVGAANGVPASEGALRGARRHGLELDPHRSRPLTAELVDEADLVLTMSLHHLERVRGLGGGEKASLISSFAAGNDDPEAGPPIPDPIGGGDAEYEETIETLETLVEAVIRRLEPIVAP